ncbi:hypothetical protein TVAG_330780 [Trichomonas vaginalis G3]|uniref:DUF3447 domain-containing protein n=1 Tax=Trichomonas vaginalis (strain ATCC PRA-98 / G3) TaxID=412133 RepID=A2F4P4_TRIV3|nr:proteasome regulatory particle assembly [Trichomonas vaginalis G3]EAY00149.1 hypothetical protein TVAG_330780 [Trichomonas vaginalis G3]KAI5522750.1 proteasome regulatory particle assembly [Trichomonas vaginalis G3]|eukprot:XP_001313078.1 hypothetical protein [Trichomonas vaginalis G3]
MSDQDIHPIKYSELRSIYKYYIDSFDALYQLKTENEEDLNKIYKILKTELIDSKKYLPKNLIEDILVLISYNNRYTMSYLKLVKKISDEYHVTEVNGFRDVFNYIFYKEYGIILNKSSNFEHILFENIDILSEDTIYRAIMNNDLERFISFTERDGFHENQKLESDLFPNPSYCYVSGYSLLELCCYYGAVDCFKFLITKFKSKITQTCLEFSFLGGNQEIMSECLKHQEPNEKCMKYAIISHNIDFVTFLMNEYNLKINLDSCHYYNNLDAFLVYFAQTNDINECFVSSTLFDIPSLCEYFLLHGVDINAKNNDGQTALHKAAQNNLKEIAEFLISHGANINEKGQDGENALHFAAYYNSKETAEFLISHGANINEKNNYEQTALHEAALNNSKETAEFLISHGANINEKDKVGETALHKAALSNSKEICKLLIPENYTFRHFWVASRP